MTRSTIFRLIAFVSILSLASPGARAESIVAWTGPRVGAHTDFVLHELLKLPRERA